MSTDSLYSPPPRDPNLWEPALGLAQRAAYYDPRKIIIQDGERFSGKTYGAGHAAIKHAYKNMNAVVLIMTVVKSAGLIGGIWEKMKTRERSSKDLPLGLLDIWGEAIGMEYGEERQDQARNFFIEVVNQYGKTNKIYYKSLPPGETVSARTRGIEASLVILDEIAESSNPDHLFKVLQILGRRQGVGSWADEDHKQWIPAPQQLLMCCNPPEDGPDHWLFKELAIDIPVGLGRPPIGKKEGDEGIWLHNNDPEIARYRIPREQNIWVENMEGYVDSIRVESVKDPSAGERLIHGRWVRKIAGRGLFQGFWVPEIHVPNLGTNTNLVPLASAPIIIGWDPGEGNISRAFTQRLYVPKLKRHFWRYFDSIFDLKSRLTYDEIVTAVFDRLLYWNNRVGHNFEVLHIADAQAFLKWINESGTYEFTAYEAASRRLIAEVERFKDMRPIKFVSPTKAKGSVSDRVTMIRNMLQKESLVVCQSASTIIDTFARLRKAAVRGEELDNIPKKDRNGLIHMFDALSYPPYYYALEEAGYYDDSSSEQNDVAFTAHGI